MAEFSIIDQYFNRQSYTDVTLGIGDDSALITPPVKPTIGDLCRYTRCWTSLPS